MVEVSAILASAGALTAAIKAAAPLVQSMSSGIFAQNKKAKQQLVERLDEAQKLLRQTGELAAVAADYCRTHEDVLQLLWRCREAEQCLKDNLDACRDRQSMDYAGKWQLLEAMFQNIDRDADVPRKVMMDRAAWYQIEDRTQIPMLLQQFTGAYNRALGCIHAGNVDVLGREISDMVGRLQEVETGLRITLYDRILEELKRLGQ